MGSCTDEAALDHAIELKEENLKVSDDTVIKQQRVSILQLYCASERCTVQEAKLMQALVTCVKGPSNYTLINSITILNPFPLTSISPKFPEGVTFSQKRVQLLKSNWLAHYLSLVASDSDQNSTSLPLTSSQSDVPHEVSIDRDYPIALGEFKEHMLQKTTLPTRNFTVTSLKDLYKECKRHQDGCTKNTIKEM